MVSTNKFEKKSKQEINLQIKEYQFLTSQKSSSITYWIFIIVSDSEAVSLAHTFGHEKTLERNQNNRQKLHDSTHA